MKKKEDKNSRVRDQYTVVLEDIRSQVQGVAENVVDIHRKLDKHTEILDGHTETLNKHGAILTSHTEMIGELMMDVQEIKNELKQKVSRDEFARLEKRVLMIEQRNR